MAAAPTASRDASALHKSENQACRTKVHLITELEGKDVATLGAKGGDI